MTAVQAEKMARPKLSLLQLAQELGNVSKACRIVGYSRQQFYEIRRSLQLHGADGLIDRLPGARGPHPNRVPAPVEEAILAHALEYPTHGAQRVADELMLRGIQVNSGGVRGVWVRNGRGMKGRTPYDVFKAGIPKTSPARKTSARKEVKTAA